MNFAEYYKFGEGLTLNNWINGLHDYVALKLFKNQDKVIGHNDGATYPKLKVGAYEYLFDVVQEAATPMFEDIVYGLLDSLYRDVINAGAYKEDLEEWFDQEYEDWEDMYPNGVPVEEYAGVGEISGRMLDER